MDSEFLSYPQGVLDNFLDQGGQGGGEGAENVEISRFIHFKIAVEKLLKLVYIKSEQTFVKKYFGNQNKIRS